MLDVNRPRILRSSLAVALFAALPAMAQAAPASSPNLLPSATMATQLPPGDAAATDPNQPPPPPPPPATAAPGGLKLEGSGVSLKLGFLIQPAYEYNSVTGASDADSSVFFLRRARLLLGFTLGSMFELFVDTDSPRLGYATGATGSTGMNLQDAFVTVKPLEEYKDEFKLDVGFFLIPLSHNSLQSAASLNGLDYFALSFQQIAGLGSYVGRDTGIQARGLVANHLEYRLALLTGRRAEVMAGATPPSRTSPRIAARVQYNVWDPETGYFYGGTYNGTKKVLSFGAGIDHQNEYTAFALDGFLDLPFGDDVLTAQANFIHYDGGTWIPALLPQNDFMVEVGYRLGAIKLSPIVRFEDLSYTGDMGGSVARYSAGVAYWYMNHNANVKLFYTYVKPSVDTSPSSSQVDLQMQFYVF